MLKLANIVITVNSPGEVSGWLKPAVKAIKALPLETVINVFIPPCTFASGKEADVVRQMPWVDKVFGPTEFLKFTLLRGSLPGFEKLPEGLVLFLGGDLTHAWLLSKKLHYPAIAYTEGLTNWVDSFERFMMPYPQMAEKALQKGVAAAKIQIVGNLMLDAAQPQMESDQVRRTLRIGDRPLLLFMPGSRPGHFEYLVPFYIRVFEIVKEKIPEIAAVFSISPFIADDVIRQGMSGPMAQLLEQPFNYNPGDTGIVNGSIGSIENPGLITTKSGQQIPAVRGHQYELMAAANLAISLPGTNTFELAALGVPAIVIFPLNYPERIPLEGIPGLIGGIPILGKALKRKLLPKIWAKNKFTAWPNRLAQEFIIPELGGIVTAEAVGSQVVRLLTDKEEYQRISNRLQEVVGEKAAASRLAGIVWEVLQQKYGRQ